MKFQYFTNSQYIFNIYFGFLCLMSTKSDLTNNPKSRLIRRIYKGKTFSINLPRSITDQLKLTNTDYMALYVSNDKIIFEKVKTGLENKEN